MSILTTMLVAGLLGLAALGVSSASADVLCDELYLSDCPAANTYGVGTEFHTIQHGGIFLKNVYGATIFACGLSTLDLKVTNAGGSFYQYPEVAITNLTFSGCGEDTASTVSGGNALISKIGGGSVQGLFHWSNSQISTFTHVYGKEQGLNCKYSIADPGTLSGAKTEEGSSRELTKIIFKSTLAKAVNSPVCFQKAYFSAQYDVVEPELEWPKSIYLAQE